MAQCDEARRDGHPGRASKGVVAGAIDSFDGTIGLVDHQAVRLSRRFGLTPATAALVADLAFHVTEGRA